MALNPAVVSVTTSATLLCDGTNGTATVPVSALVSVPSGGQTVFLGGPGVTAATGFPLAAGGSPVSVDLVGGDSLYGIVAGTTQNTNVLRTRS